MKVPANLSGDRLILDYLAQVTEAGLHYLPKGARMAFVGRTRDTIEQECGPAGLGDPARVVEVLTGLGEPEELVRAERARIDADWARRRSGQPETAAAAPQAERPSTPGTDREADTRPLPREPLPWWAGGEDGQPGDAGAPGTPRPESLNGPLAGRPAALAATAARLARSHPLESAAVVLLGIGGLILPFPFWLVGALTAMPSKLFDIRDKWTALLGPVVTVVVGTMVAALILRGHGNPIVIYFHALGLDTGILLRIGSVICAAYLARRVHQGRRVRVPPWKR